MDLFQFENIFNLFTAKKLLTKEISMIQTEFLTESISFSVS